MNFDDDRQPQRPIEGAASLDEKIASSPSPYPAARRRSRGSRSSSSDDDDNDNNDRPVDINDADVLCGRGKNSFNHAGNKRFRDIITSSIPEYNRADSRLEKSLVVHAIVENIRSVGGRFLKVDQSGQWRELDDRACREKVGHAIRDAATTTENRRQKKMGQRYPPLGGASGLGQSRGQISRYNEMKMDTPDPISFHDVVHSTIMGRPIAYPAINIPRHADMHHNRAHSLPQMPAATVPLLPPQPSTANTALTQGPRRQSLPLPPHPADPNAALTQSPRRQSLAPSIGHQNPDDVSGGIDNVDHDNFHDHEDDHHHHPDEAGFMEQINQVLGPMPPNHSNDPLADLLDLP